MAGDRGRDLKISVLSDVDRFELDKPAEQLEELGRNASDAGRQLDTAERGLDSLGDSARGTGRDLDSADRKLEDVGDTARDTERDLERADDTLDRVGKTAQDTARDTARAFDKIADASRRNLRNRLDDDADKAAGSLHEVRDEANDTAREMGASFDGSAESVMDAFQELGANAGVAFGPIGIAAGAAAAVGVGLIRAESEKLKELTSDMVQAMIDAGGQLSEEFINQKLQEMAADGTLLELQDQAARLGLSFEDLARAKAGDAEASERTLEKVAELSTALTDQAAASGAANGEMYAQQGALGELARELGSTVKAQHLAKRAMEALGTASRGAGGDVTNSAHVMGAEWDDLRSNLGRPIRARVAVDAPSSAELDAINRRIRNGVGTIVIPVKAGQSPYANTSNNSKYRW